MVLAKWLKNLCLQASANDPDNEHASYIGGRDEYHTLIEHLHFDVWMG